MRIDVDVPCVEKEVGMPRGMGACLGHKMSDDTVWVCDGEVERHVCPHQLCRGLIVLLWRCWGGSCGCGGLMAQWVGARSALGDAGRLFRQRGIGPEPSARCPVPASPLCVGIPYRSAAATA